MALITTVGSSDADSYISLADANTYLTDFYGDTPTTWDALDEGPREQRLRIAVLLLNSFPWRGVKASFNQRLAFPRFWHTDDEYEWLLDDEEYFLDFSEITENIPTVPTEVKYAQVEIAYQVVNHIMTLDPLAFAEKEIKMFELGGSLSIEFFGESSNGSRLNKAKLSSLDIVYAYLNKWYQRVGGGVV